MPRIASRRRPRPAALTALALPLACLTLAACGGSSSSGSSSSGSSSTNAASASPSTTSSTSSTPSTSAPSGKAGVAPAAGKRFSALRECLQKAGITLPRRTVQPRGGLPYGPRGAPQLPKGVTSAQYQAALARCAGVAGGRFGGGSAPRRLSSPGFTKALARFAACMRENGINVPEPNTTGKGPVFSTKGLNPTSAKFKAAQVKCASALRAGLRAQPGAGGAPPAG